MVAVGAVLGGQLPVAFVDVAGGTAQHFQALGGLVDDHVDDLRRLAEVLDQRDHVGIQAAEQEAAVGLEAGDLGQVVGAVAVEAVRVAGFERILDLEQLAVGVEGPAVERAGVGRLVAVLEAAQGGATVAAGVDEGVQLTVAVAGDEYRLATHGDGVVVVLLGNLALVCEIDPVAFEDVLHLQLEQLGVGEHLPLAAVEALLLVFFEQGVEIIRSHGHGCALRCCFCAVEVRLSPRPGGQYPLSARSLSAFCTARQAGTKTARPARQRRTRRRRGGRRRRQRRGGQAPAAGDGLSCGGAGCPRAARRRCSCSTRRSARGAGSRSPGRLR
ncbi:hypothetical protein D3C80_925920 [compost metagenome]